MAHAPSDYHRGEMDIHEQVKTYEFVMSLTKWGSLTVAVSVLFATLWFCTGAGFMGALATAIVLAVLGGVFLRGGGGH
ncbi:MAG TPA: aa3-type cytochrome c oxidase subunit IV [Phenylobacterium sp.]|uniref:aa3-type cytochrome c oxidase subunit IV n=1 Tax=Phenylobacterium sp. TaxID=1871053 RepID=UPI002B46ABA3|nr:aa3-type cytochrome c oxidase subunit IV [Phenylobacterium sp.]HKR87214.1 aa3-type cytochrome c oxidase subunit IV [Phenylobacterium sp.]